DLSVTKSLKQLNRSNGDPAPRSHHHWQEELRFAAGLGSHLSRPEWKNNDRSESIARKISPGARCRNARRFESAGGGESESVGVSLPTPSRRLGRALRRRQERE